MESSIQQVIHALVAAALVECFQLEHATFVVEQPKDITHGDYATNAALVIANTLEIPPQECAEKLTAYLNEHKPQQCAAITIAGPGFINFSLSKEYFNTELKKIITQGDQWGNSKKYEGKHILVEHSSPNLFKPFHIGHVMNNAIGESITRLAKFSGAKVETMTFPSDISLGVAKAIFALMEKYGADGVTSIGNYLNSSGIDILGIAYVEGTKCYDEDERIHGRVKEIADNLYNQTPSSELDIFNLCKEYNIAYFKRITTRLGSEFDSYKYESEAGIEGKKIVLAHVPDVFIESEGAIVYMSDENRKDINTAVFINSQGNPTYEAKDIGLLSMKFAKEHLGFSIFITDTQQVSHFQVVLDAAHKINAAWSERSVHVSHGRMTFKGQKMSSRLGGMPLAETLLDTVSEEVKERATELADEAIDYIAIAALKFSILRAAAGKDINFDPETSLSFEGDSGPYVQYSTVRARSLLSKAQNLGAGLLSDMPEGWQVTNLEKLLIHFPEVVEHAIEQWSPHFIVTYMLEVAQAFNSWYGTTKIIDENDTTSSYKLAITKDFAHTMTNGLTLLGISVPEKM